MSNVKKCWQIFWSIYLRPKFSTQMPWLFIIKICFTIKVNSVCGAGRDIRNLCHKLNSQGPALRILCLSVASPRDPVPGSWVSRSQFQGPECQGPVSQGPRVPSPRVSDPGSQGSRSQGPWSRVSGPDFRLRHSEYALIYMNMSNCS